MVPMARRARWFVAFLIRFESRRRPSAWAVAFDAAVAVAATAVALVEAYTRKRASPALPKDPVYDPVTVTQHGTRTLIGYGAVVNGKVVAIFKDMPDRLPPLPHPSPLIAIAIVATALPLAVRRLYPTACALVILISVVAIRDWVPPVVFATAAFAAYSAVVHSRYRQLAAGVVLTGAVIITMTFPNTLPNVSQRYSALIVAFATLAAGLGMRELSRRAGDSVARLHRAQAEHAAATQRALEQERARIAAELHDVVTHNVSVMVVQAGAARQILGRSPAAAREALLAIEASGRNAMTELRHLLGLLAPDRSVEAILQPQPCLDEIPALIACVQAAGLAVELTVTGTAAPLPLGLDLAAYRVVQEALTNVIKHADGARTLVHITWGTELEVTISNDGAYGSTTDGAAGGRGLIGLRERAAIYGGSLDAGPRPGGGWRVRGRFPLERPVELRVLA
jgi:signal transduction histidine kinase